MIQEELINNVISLAKDIPIVVDPKKRNFHHFKNVTLFKPNLKEMLEGLLDHIDDFKYYLRKIDDSLNQLTIL